MSSKISINEHSKLMRLLRLPFAARAKKSFAAQHHVFKSISNPGSNLFTFTAEFYNESVSYACKYNFNFMKSIQGVKKI